MKKNTCRLGRRPVRVLAWELPTTGSHVFSASAETQAEVWRAAEIDMIVGFVVAVT